PLCDRLLEALAARDDVRAVVLSRTSGQADRIRAMQLSSLVVPDHAVDGQSLVAGADLVISAGGTMNREAVVLGTPVYTTFAGRMGGVDERLIADGRLRSLERLEDLIVERKPEPAGEPLRRDPERLIDLAFEGLRSA